MGWLMAVEDAIIADLTPGMQITAKGASKRYGVAYSTAQKALRRLWRSEFISRGKNSRNKREYVYEGRQERLL